MPGWRIRPDSPKRRSGLSSRPGLRSAIENGARLAAINWVEQVLRVIYIVLLARYLGAEDYGYWAYGLALSAVAVGLSGVGFDTLMSLRLGADKSSASGYLSMALSLRLTCFAVAVVGLIVYTLLVESDPVARVVLLILAPALVGRGLSLWARAAFLAYERTREYMSIGILFRIAEVGTGSVWLLSGGGLLGIVLIHALFWVWEGAIGVRAVSRRLAPLGLQFSGQDTRDMLRHGLVLSLAAAFQAWLLAGPLVMVRAMTDEMVALGQLAIALNAMGILAAFAGAFASAALPVISRAAGRDDPQLSRYGLLTLIGVFSAILPLAVIATIFGPPFAVWLLGPDFEQAGRLMGPAILLAGLVIAPTGYGQILLLAGRRDVPVYASASGALFLLLAMGPALQLFGAVGAIAAAGSAWSVRAAVQILWAHRIKKKIAVN